jgi:hypothetical protein
MNTKNDRASLPPPGSPAPKRRFRLAKLEDRIAPTRGGKGTKNCPHYSASMATANDCGPY